MAEWKVRADNTRATLVAGNPEKAAQEWIDSYSGPGTWEMFPLVVKQIILDNIWSVTDSGEWRNISCANIQKFSFPIMLLTGEQSPKIYGEIIFVLRKCEPDIPAPIIVPKGTHSMHASNPIFFYETVLEFLKKH